MKKILLRLSVLIGLLIFTVPGYADLWNGSVNAGSGGGITAEAPWNVNSTILTWKISDLKNGWVSYDYTWKTDEKELGYIILEISKTATLERFSGFRINEHTLYKGVDYQEGEARDTYEGVKLSTYRFDGSDDPDDAINPGMPGPLYGLKFGGDEEFLVEISFLSKRLPMWGNFYAKNSDNLYAYNTGFGTGEASGDGNFIAVPDTREVPIPAAVWLFGTGLFGLVGVRRRMSRI